MRPLRVAKRRGVPEFGSKGCYSPVLLGGFPKLGVPFWVVPKIRTIVFWGLDWGPLILGNYHLALYLDDRETWQVNLVIGLIGLVMASYGGL